MTVDKAQDAIEVARRVLDVVSATVGQSIVEAKEATTAQARTAEDSEFDKGYDAGFEFARKLTNDIRVEGMDLAAIVKAVFPGESV